MTQTFDSALVWFRRDLRSTDHAALYHALKNARKVWCAFVFDTDILDELPRFDRRVDFIHRSVIELDQALETLGQQHPLAQLTSSAASGATAGLIVRHGSARVEIPKLAAQLGVQAVYANHDDEPAALERDAHVRGPLSNIGVALFTSKDHVIFERNEVLTGNDSPYGVFTPYKNAWLKKIEPFYVKPYPVERFSSQLAPIPAKVQPIGQARVPTLKALGFEEVGSLKVPAGMSGAHSLLDDFLHRIDRYDETRNFPGIKGPSYLSTHLRFGTVSIRQLAGLAWDRAKAGSTGAQTWLSELIWRDFYHQILFHHPHVVGQAYKREYDLIKWAHGAKAEAHFQAWCEGRTGYPLVDAAMRQLNQTGYMHNRLRMVVASFLIKDLGIDWRRGEAYFAEKLLDFDLAANNGGWQWAASSGCDAQPWFRIFNPINQSEKFDPQGKFIRRYVPELAALPDQALHAPWLARPADLACAEDVVIGRDYPQPIVMHDVARQETLDRYAVVKTVTDKDIQKLARKKAPRKTAAKAASKQPGKA
ncbi:MAG TPA: deoxyribodipyrimidine photo-lyase [Aquabacterium sp.]|uniref:cryptochrome/photolyase family protein n=1 Tax=Aquabacterium sp. TaxID=1872578 RepID=UPI002E2FAA33|nr:deoxyribodipyrimidine photo-lyase [Aquabacterium sp.]HEX5356822.1 deoxyribodipyrimidine photo-lyase [Aquabacterium sp.]